MLKLIRILAILSFFSLIAVGCTSPSPGVVKATSTSIPPTPSPIIFTYPVIATPPPPPQATPSCFLGVFFCTTPTPIPCQPHYIYDDLIDMGTSWIVVDHLVDQNNNKIPIQVTFTSTAKKTVMVTDLLGLTVTSTASEGISVEGIQAAITQSVQLTINVSVSESLSTAISNSPTVSIPARQTAFANFGVQVQITEGRLYDQAGCEGGNSYFGADITYVPFGTGWCTWESGGTPCPSIKTL